MPRVVIATVGGKRKFSQYLLPFGFPDYLHGIKDNSVHCVDEVENLFEALKYQEENPCLLSSENAVETKCTEQIKNIERTTTRVSLTCRSVLKVRKISSSFRVAYQISADTIL
ncbi:hypothetical protein GIB67_041203 [Kingdonia uniflora]|uniref:Uncharacterized protein n=1 Tax=Kingdonia uniflora TaxID=39325 RepID=A0A7J7LRD7_9MAGN|nr:hypothetical protein GIB67_041203 [Kingdonia uniflora]